MKMLLVIGPRGRETDIRETLERHGARSYTEIPEVLGQGEHGKHLGTHVFPGTSALMFSVLSEEEAGRVVQSLRELKSHFYAGESLRVFALPVETLL